MKIYLEKDPLLEYVIKLAKNIVAMLRKAQEK